MNRIAFTLTVVISLALLIPSAAQEEERIRQPIVVNPDRDGQGDTRRADRDRDAEADRRQTFMPEIEPIHALEITTEGVIIQVRSNGCTDKDSFLIDVNKGYKPDSELALLTLYRIAPDNCNEPDKDGVEIVYSLNDLNLNPGAEIRLFNSFTAAMMPRTQPAGRFIVLAQTDSTTDGPPYENCQIVPTDAMYAAIYTEVFGPTSREAAEEFIEAQCASSQHN